MNLLSMELEMDIPSTNSAAVCPACGADVELAYDMVVGEVLYCEHCGMELELIGVEPPRLELFEEEEK